MQTGLDQVKSSWLRCGYSDHPAQLCFELFAELLRDRVISLERLRRVLFDGRMILDSHRFRPASTRFQNSVSFNGWTCPLSISRSRRSTSASSSASDQSSPSGGRELSNDSASKTRCSTGKASSVFSISARADMYIAYRSGSALASQSWTRANARVAETIHSASFPGDFIFRPCRTVTA
jgi:hypothetical protein